MQAAGCGIGLAGEFAARMKCCQDDFHSRLAREFRVFAHRHAAAIVADGQPVAALQMDIDAGGMAGHRLIHRIVEDLGRQMMQRPLVGAADIHARPVPDRLQPFKNLDIGSVIAFGIRRGPKQIGHLSPVFRTCRARVAQMIHASVPYGPPGTGRLHGPVLPYLAVGWKNEPEIWGRESAVLPVWLTVFLRQQV